MLAACGTVPGTGPTTDQILDADGSVAITTGERPPSPYALLSVDLSVAERISAWAPAISIEFPTDEPPQPSQLTLRPGDEVEITIVNSSPQGFFNFGQSVTAVSPLATTSLPPQQVGFDGGVSVPPIGRIPAAGLTPQRLETGLERRLGEVLVDPSVIVRLTDRLDSRVSVMGDVAQAGTYPILNEDTRLLDIVTASGGPIAPADEVDLLLIRNGRESRLRFDRFLANPQHNIVAWPDDVLKFEPATRRVTLLGATDLNDVLDFAQPSLSLAQALSRGSGLTNTQAARDGVFVFRMTERAILEELSSDSVLPFDQATVPTVYHFDFTEPEVLFAAQRFEIQDEDLIYIPDAPLAELDKVVSIFRDSLGIARDISIIAD